MSEQMKRAFTELYHCNKPLNLIFWLASQRNDPSVSEQILDWYRVEDNRAGIEAGWMALLG